MGAKFISLTLMGVLLIGIWVWMHFAQSYLLIFFGGSHVQVTIGDGSVEGHLVVGKPQNISSLLDMDIMANSTSYAMLTPPDCIYAAEPKAVFFPNNALPESLFVDEPEDPFSAESPQPDPFSVTNPSILATLFGGRPSFAWDQGGGLFQLILAVPYYFVVITSSVLAAILLCSRKGKRSTEQDESLKP